MLHSMELLFAIVLICNLQFNSCSFSQSHKGFTTVEACKSQLTRDLIEAERKRPDELGDLNYPRFEIFGICRSRLGVRVKA